MLLIINMLLVTRMNTNGLRAAGKARLALDPFQFS
jgi:hypothetical protein